MNRVDKAVELFKQGCTCSQAVFVAYADIYGIDEPTALKLSVSFGGGMGGMREVCGTVSAMTMVAGLSTNSEDSKTLRRDSYELTKLLAGRFKEQNGSIVCRQLLGLEPGLPEGCKKKPCVEYVRTCAKLIEELILNKEQKFNAETSGA